MGARYFKEPATLTIHDLLTMSMLFPNRYRLLFPYLLCHPPCLLRVPVKAVDIIKINLPSSFLGYLKIKNDL